MAKMNKLKAKARTRVAAEEADAEEEEPQKTYKFRVPRGTGKQGGGRIEVPNPQGGIDVYQTGDVFESTLPLHDMFANKVELLPETKKVKVTGPSGVHGAQFQPKPAKLPSNDEEGNEDVTGRLKWRDRNKMSEEDPVIHDEDEDDDLVDEEDIDEDDADADQEPVRRKKSKGAAKKAKKKKPAPAEDAEGAEDEAPAEDQDDQ